ATCTAALTVVDNQNPSLACPGPITQSADPGDCDTSVSFVATASDNCGATLSYDIGGTSINSPHTFPVGTTIVNVVASDSAGNTNACTFTVTVVDNQAPTIICPADISQDNDANNCGAIVNYIAPVGADNCLGATTAQTAGLASGSLFPVGVTTNTFVVTDAAGNTATCSFTVTVSDAQPPAIVCPADITQNTDANACGAT